METNKMKKCCLLVLLLAPMSAMATVSAGSFTPTSVLVPIYQIGFSNGTSNVTAWSCATQTAAGCTVDIADTSALATAFTGGSVNVATGTYSAMYANTCNGGTGYTLQVKGSVTIGGTTYTTQSGAEPLTTSATPEYASISLSGCQANIYLPAGVTIASGKSLTVNLLTTLKNMVLGYRTTTRMTSANFPANCITGTLSALCVAYPSLIPYVGSNTPTANIYLLTSSASDTAGANAFGQFIEYVDPSGNILGISTAAVAGASTVLSGDSSSDMNTPCPSGGCNWAITPFASPIYSITKNADGTLNLQGYGDSGSTDPTKANISITNFPLPAVGAVSSSFALSNPSGKIFSSPVTIYTTRTQ